MRTNGGFQISKIKQLGDRVFEKILTAQGIEAFNGAQGRILYVLWQEDGVPIKTIAERCGLAMRNFILHATAPNYILNHKTEIPDKYGKLI